MRAIIFLCLILAACNATGPRFSDIQPPIPAGQSRIYLLRESGIYASGQFARISLDGKRVGSLANGGYLMFDIPPGKHIATASDLWSDSNAPFEINAGSTAYLQVSPGSLTPIEIGAFGGLAGVIATAPANTGFYQMEFLPPEIGLARLRGLALSQ